MGGKSNDIDDAPPPTDDPAMKWLMSRVQKIEKRIAAIEDEGDPWLRHFVTYLKNAYSNWGTPLKID